MVKQEFKTTDIGVIPMDWEITPLKEICKTGGIVRGPFGGALKKEMFVKTGYKVYEQGNAINHTVKYGHYFVDENKFSEMKRFAVISGDFIVSCSGTIGKIYQLPVDCPEGIINQALLKLTINPAMVDDKFFYYYFSWDYFNNSIIDDTQGGAMKNLVGMDVFREMPLAIPILEEQKSIAEALTDMDSLIENLEKLIEKKKAIKQGAMQELLSSKKRLPGFTGDWICINMAQHSRIKARIGWQGLTTAEYLDDGFSLLITGTDFKNGIIDWQNCHYVTKERYDQDANIQIRNGDILITKDGTIGKVALVSGLNKPATLNSGVFVVRPKDNSYSEKFLFNILRSDYFKDFLDKLSAGSTIVHLYQKDIVNFEFNAPKTIQEQEAIANLLLDMDMEIEKLESKLKKYKQVKLGMMQKLLTGEIRLV